MKKQDIADILLTHPLFKACEKQSIANILPQLDTIEFTKGQNIANRGDEANCLYVIIQGSVRNSGTFSDPVESDLQTVGQECVNGLTNYVTTTTATENTLAIKIRRKDALELAAVNKGFKQFLTDELLQMTTNSQTSQSTKYKKSADKQEKSSLRFVLGWSVAIIVPMLILIFGAKNNLPQETTLFLATFAATVTMWVFRLVDEYIPAIFALFSLIILGVATPNIALSGFQSDGFFLAMSILGISALVKSSGLSYRFMLWLLTKLPNKESWHNFGLLLTGIMITPAVPSINGRVSLIAPLAKDMTNTLNHEVGGRASSRIAVSAFMGVTVLSPIFMTSKSVNFVIYGLLPYQLQDQFQWSFWLMAAAVTGLILLCLHLLLDRLILNQSRTSQSVSKDIFRAQLRVLGPMSGSEWSSFIGIGVFIIGVATSAWTGISPPWMSLAILYALLVYGFIQKRDFREGIDWPFLLYLAGISGIAAVFHSLGLDSDLAANISWLGEYLRTNFYLYVVMLAVMIFVVRLLVPITSTIVIIASIMMPLAEAQGLNPWVAGFVILVLGEMWFFPYQCSYYIQFRDALHHIGIYKESTLLKFNALMNIGKLAAIFGSMPYWKSLGLL